MKTITKTLRTFKEDDRFLTLSVFKNSNSNSSMSSALRQIYIPCKYGNVQYKNIEDDSLIFIEEQRAKDYFALKPIVVPLCQNHFSAMFGGNLANSSDSRCKHIYRIHDRFENKHKYFDVLSPDGFSIHPTDVYDGHDNAKKALKDWISNYERQGYYSSNEDGRIPLKELSGWCHIIPIK